MKEYLLDQTKKFGDRFGLDLPYFLGNGFWVVCRQMVGALSSLSVSVALAHLASQDVFGQYQFIFSVLSIVAILALPGLNTSLLQSVSRGNDGDYAVSVRKSFLWSIIGVPILAIIGLCYYVYSNQSIGIGFLVASIFFPFFYSLNLWDGFLQAKKLFRLTSIFSMFQSISSALLLLATTYYFHASLSIMIFTYLAIHVLFNVFFIYKSLHHAENSKKDDSTIPFGLFLTKLSILGTIASNLDRVIIGMFISMETLSVYAVGTLFVIQVFELVKAFLSTVAPKIANNTLVSRRNYLIVALLSALAIPFLIFGVWFILNNFYPLQFSVALQFFIVGIIFLPFYSLSVLYNFQIIFLRNKKIIAWSAIIFHSLRIALMPLFAGIFGVWGLALLVGFQHLLFLVVAFLLKTYFGRLSTGEVEEQ